VRSVVRGVARDADTFEAIVTKVRSTRIPPLAEAALSIAYGKLGRIGEASWALAEYSFLIGDAKQVWGNISRAERLLKRGSPAWNRIQDLKREMGRREGRQRRRR
jgi:predicted Zn-dependent protease